MLLRRFTQHLKDQNWFAVGLDVIVVIVGIFLGMQVTEWNEERQDKEDNLIYIKRIHGELIDAENASNRVRTRRLELIGPLSDAGRVIFDEEEPRELTNEHCFALGTSHFFNINAPDLPSMAELMSAGRIYIIQDAKMRTDLIKLQQIYGSLQKVIEQSSPLAHNLPVLHPELITAEPYYDEVIGEMQGKYRCNLSGMKQSLSFRNQLSENIDAYDAYLRDGLRPWSKQMDIVHEHLDGYLDIQH